ncbi:MAG: hypothetical protein K2L49_07370, partial [Muribaculaceae bacterium]|nr:hypothetical protein [Muribaculaceae bacterium]
PRHTTSRPGSWGRIFVYETGTDSIVVRPDTRYMPDDVLLTWFNENYKAQYLSDYGRKDRNRLTMQFGAPSDTLPVLTLINGPEPDMPSERWALLEHSLTRDTLTYWITDTSVLRQDTLMIAAQYLRNDTLQQLSWTVDTLKFQYREPRSKRNKKKEEEKALTAESVSAEDSVVAAAVDTVPQPKSFLSFSVSGSGAQDVHKPLIFGASQPLDSIMRRGVHLEIQRDTLWDTVAHPVIYRPEPSKLLSYRMDYEWEPGAKYRLTIDSTAIVGIYGEWNRPIRHEFTVKNLEDYSSVVFNVEGLDSLPAVAELLNTSDKPVASVPVVDGRATFVYVNPGTYYARLYIDRNRNGEYDTGDLLQRRQPEEVYYYSKKLNLKKNWDMEQTWNITELPLDQQKPIEIKKNKPKLRKGEERPTGSSDDEEEFDEFYNPEDPFNPGGNRYGNQYGGSGNRLSGGYRR